MLTPAVRTALYRLYDEHDVLLYIGISETPEKRWSAHASNKPWWPQVARKTVQWFDSRPLAEAAEATALATERTPYNVAGSPWAPKPRELAPHEMLIGQASARLGAMVDRANRGEIIVLVDTTRERKPVACILPTDLDELVDRLGGLDAARTAMRSLADQAQG